MQPDDPVQKFRPCPGCGADAVVRGDCLVGHYKPQDAIIREREKDLPPYARIPVRYCYLSNIPWVDAVAIAADRSTASRRSHP